MSFGAESGSSTHVGMHRHRCLTPPCCLRCQHRVLGATLAGVWMQEEAQPIFQRLGTTRRGGVPGAISEDADVLLKISVVWQQWMCRVGCEHGNPQSYMGLWGWRPQNLGLTLHPAFCPDSHLRVLRYSLCYIPAVSHYTRCTGDRCWPADGLTYFKNFLIM